MWYIVVAVFQILGFLSSINAVMTARTSQGAIAWVISLITFPYIAVPAYWLLGRSKFKGYARARQSDDIAVKEKLAEVLDGVAPFLVPEASHTGTGRAAQGLAYLPFLSGNSLKLLIDGNETFDSIIEGIDAAKDYILFQFFIVKDDGIGRKVKDHLIAKAREGVKVFFIYDEIGSKDLTKAYKNELRNAGAQVREFHTQKGIGNRFQINFRNHRKIVVVDGQVSWVGGHNVGDEYLGLDPKFGNWRDTHMRIDGPATVALQISFFEDWYWATDEYMMDLNWKPTKAASGNKTVLVVATGPADPLETAALMFLHAINTAQKRIWIASPYFVPDDAIVAALQLAGLRGVDVRILIPDKPDHLLVYLAAFSYFKDASKTGVRFFRYTDGFLHQKVMLVDDQAATVGTANFDNRSFRLNFEVTALIADTEFAAEIEQMFKDDLARATEMQMADLDKKPFWFNLAVSLARLTSPVQ